MTSIIKAGVIGFPVAHSLSPRLHGFWLKKYNINGEYKAYEVAPEKLGEFISSLAANGFAGVNLTIPHKELALPMLTHVDEVAKTVGAANTIVVKEGKLTGTNTDVYGFTENIRAHILGKKKAVILGAGGAAKAVLRSLFDLGFKEIYLTNRTQSRAEEIAKPFGHHVVVTPWQQRDEMLKDADLLVNTTSLGLKNNPPLDINLEKLPNTSLVTDIVYSPLITPLLEKAKARGNPIVDGLGMLLHQAVPGFEAWFGIRPEVTDELREHMLHG